MGADLALGLDAAVAAAAAAAMELDLDLAAVADGADDGYGYVDAAEDAENVRTLTHQTILVHLEECKSSSPARVVVVAATAVAVDVRRTDVGRLECQP